MEIWTEPDVEEPDGIWIDLTGDDLATTESSTWKVEMYAALAAQTTKE